MTLTDIAFLNLRRRRAKAAFVLAGLLVGVSTVVGLVSLVRAMTADVNEKLEKYGANILVVPRTENLSLNYGGLALGGVSFEMEEIRQSDLDRIRSIKNANDVAAIGPMALGAAAVGDHTVLLAGVEFDAARILKPWWRLTGAVPGPGGALLGAEAARVLGLGVGDLLDLGEQSLRVTGVLQATGSQDDHLVFAQLATAQALLGKEGRVSMVEVAALCGNCPIEEMVRQISEVLPGAKVMAIQQVVKGRMETLGHFRTFSIGVSAMVVGVGALVVLVTMMGSVRERTREIGVFRAIGFRRSHVVRIVLLEAGVVSAAAGLLGYLAGFGGIRLVVPLFTEGRAVSMPFDPTLAGGAIALAVVTGLLASAYPAFLASRMDPNEALRAL